MTTDRPSIRRGAAGGENRKWRRNSRRSSGKSSRSAVEIEIREIIANISIRSVLRVSSAASRTRRRVDSPRTDSRRNSREFASSRRFRSPWRNARRSFRRSAVRSDSLRVGEIFLIVRYQRVVQREKESFGRKKMMKVNRSDQQMVLDDFQQLKRRKTDEETSDG